MPLGTVLKATNFIMDPTGQPMTLVNHVINYGWEYMWHCHILAHEEMDAMRTIIIGNPPIAPSYLVATVQGSSVVLTWKDNSLSETEFILERASDSAFTTNLMTVQLPANTNTYTDKTYKKGTTYYYRVIARNIVGDTADYSPANGFPTLTLDSTPTIAGPPAGTVDFLSKTRSSAKNAPIVLIWSYSPSGDQTGFTIQRATDPAMTKNVRTFTVAGTVHTYSDSTAAPNTTYYYRIQATNALGAGDWSIIQ
jgi:FtsP/CotA-like multicopper oxidase with cupredoxin domain